MSRDSASDSKGIEKGVKSTQTDEKLAPKGGKNLTAQDGAKGEKSKSMSSETDTKGAKDMKAEGRDSNRSAQSRDGQNSNMNAQSREGQTGNMKAQKGGMDSQSQTTTQSQPGQTNQSQTTTGQAGAGGKISTEQRTKITTVIKEQHVQPVTNVNFSISVGTRVPRSGVTFHPLPAEIVTFYPQWRGYEYILVRDQILVIDPRTGEIVDVIDT